MVDGGLHHLQAVLFLMLFVHILELIYQCGFLGLPTNEENK